MVVHTEIYTNDHVLAISHITLDLTGICEPLAGWMVAFVLVEIIPTHFVVAIEAPSTLCVTILAEAAYRSIVGETCSTS